MWYTLQGLPKTVSKGTGERKMVEFHDNGIGGELAFPLRQTSPSLRMKHGMANLIGRLERKCSLLPGPKPPSSCGEQESDKDGRKQIYCIVIQNGLS